VSSLAYLALAVVISFVGAVTLWYRHRRPRSLEEGIDDFARELRALSPERRPDNRGDHRSG
jgi:hypothetical protein